MVASMYLDVKGFLSDLAREGAQIQIDGWEPRLVGRRPTPERMRELLANKLPLLYHLVSVAPRRCETCEGVGTVEYLDGGDLHWFCTAHEPTTDGLYLLWEASRKRAHYARLHQELVESGVQRTGLIEKVQRDLVYWSAEYDALSSQLHVI